MKKLNLFLAALFTATVMNLQAATPDYLYFTSLKADGTGTVKLNKYYRTGGSIANLTATFEYSKDRINWTNYTWNASIGTTIALADGDTVFFRAKGNNGKNATMSSSNSDFDFEFGANDSIAAGGNIMSLYDASCEQDTMTAYGFRYLFSKTSTQLISASELKLSATKLAEFCYNSMFYGCRALTQAPELKADTLANGCCMQMFRQCRSLVTAPALPATTLAESCYSSMFYTCTSLVNAPALPATTLAENCYGTMFASCIALTQAPELKATKLAVGCYGSMFMKCTALTQAPELKADTLAESCYGSMFINCTALTQAPELPATTLEKKCYYNMFSNCTALTQAPELLATTLADSCYMAMFKGDTSLIQAPELKATTLANSCYLNMFNGCSKLEVDTFSLICDGAELVVPSVSGDAPTDWNKDMFTGCKGTAVGNIQLGGHYCIREYGKPRPIYGRKVTNGNFGTICLDKQFVAMEGVEGLYVPATKDANYLYCEPVEVKDVKAGYAYIFKANADSVTFAFEGEAVTAAVEANSMLGWLEADKTIDNAFLTTYANYSLLGIPAGGTEQQIVKPLVGSEILKNCAMINLTTVEGGTPAPERRCIRLGVNTPTGMVDVNATRMSDVHKFVNNGQLIIIREGRKFNAQGQEL